VILVFYIWTNHGDINTLHWSSINLVILPSKKYRFKLLEPYDLYVNRPTSAYAYILMTFYIYIDCRTYGFY